MPNSFTFNGIDSSTLGVYISGTGVFNAPERGYKFISVPGRDGDLIGYEKRLQNIQIKYPCFVHSNMMSKVTTLKSNLLAVIGYAKLTDTYDPDHYRKACFVGGTEFDLTSILDAAEFNLTFNCKPQKWLNIGDIVTTITGGSGTISNPTLFDAQPVIVVTGYGEMYIGSQRITISNVFASVTIDTELGDCYSGSESANEAVSLLGNDFPVLVPGTSNITHENTITKIEITPRWFEL